VDHFEAGQEERRQEQQGAAKLDRHPPRGISPGPFATLRRRGTILVVRTHRDTRKLLKTVTMRLGETAATG
jgi:hypothetical protein